MTRADGIGAARARIKELEGEVGRLKRALAAANAGLGASGSGPPASKSLRRRREFEQRRRMHAAVVKSGKATGEGEVPPGQVVAEGANSSSIRARVRG